MPAILSKDEKCKRLFAQLEADILQGKYILAYNKLNHWIMMCHDINPDMQSKYHKIRSQFVLQLILQKKD